jgi:hypothetical protein
VLAALLPAFLPFARDWDKAAPAGTNRFTVAGLLLAVAVLQLYGQQRNNRDKIKTENRFLNLVDEIREGRKEAGEGREEAEETATTIISEIARCRAESRHLYERIIQKLP